MGNEPPEEVIKWLSSKDGERWSRRAHAVPGITGIRAYSYGVFAEVKEDDEQQLRRVSWRWRSGATWDECPGNSVPPEYVLAEGRK